MWLLLYGMQDTLRNSLRFFGFCQKSGAGHYIPLGVATALASSAATSNEGQGKLPGSRKLVKSIFVGIETPQFNYKNALACLFSHCLARFLGSYSASAGLLMVQSQQGFAQGSEAGCVFLGVPLPFP